MQNSQSNEQLVLRWVPVVDAQGRTHMEAVWITTAEPVHAPHAA